jgi:hypothetical protein
LRLHDHMLDHGTCMEGHHGTAMGVGKGPPITMLDFTSSSSTRSQRRNTTVRGGVTKGKHHGDGWDSERLQDQRPGPSSQREGFLQHANEAPQASERGKQEQSNARGHPRQPPSICLVQVCGVRKGGEARVPRRALALPLPLQWRLCWGPIQAPTVQGSTMARIIPIRWGILTEAGVVPTQVRLARHLLRHFRLPRPPQGHGVRRNRASGNSLHCIEGGLRVKKLMFRQPFENVSPWHASWVGPVHGFCERAWLA